ncbi:MAG: hypothetical protein RLZ33_2988 [Bacteroidota bacterium]|jgi:hypothetical protein
MKRNFLALAALALVVASCGGPGKAEYDTAAGKICDCMSEKTAAAAADTSEFKIDMTDLDFSLCALDVATEVDPFDEQMGKSIEEKCPDLKPVHDNYVKSAK